jgi:hypothetical protein
MTFSPARVSITNITNSNPGVVTTSTEHGLLTGDVVRLHVPKSYGMPELNQLQVNINVINFTSFSIFTSIQPNLIDPVNTLTYGTFTIPSKPQFTAEVLPMGSGPTPKISPDVYLRNGVCITPIYDAIINIAPSEIPS